jgi:hypothetical protein
MLFTLYTLSKNVGVEGGGQGGGEATNTRYGITYKKMDDGHKF